jgi:hypothetical protein
MMTNTIDLASLQNQRAKYMEYRDETARLASIYKDYSVRLKALYRYGAPNGQL